MLLASCIYGLRVWATGVVLGSVFFLIYLLSVQGGLDWRTDITEVAGVYLMTAFFSALVSIPSLALLIALTYAFLKLGWSSLPLKWWLAILSAPLCYMALWPMAGARGLLLLYDLPVVAAYYLAILIGVCYFPVHPSAQKSPSLLKDE
ncbi:MAG TPA: hypothetical protein PKD78_16635 [Saprospiraceae bacterium]|nr:hypothetical protein [Saprospiraceae bacterium]